MLSRTCLTTDVFLSTRSIVNEETGVDDGTKNREIRDSMAIDGPRARVQGSWAVTLGPCKTKGIMAS